MDGLHYGVVVILSKLPRRSERRIRLTKGRRRTNAGGVEDSGGPDPMAGRASTVGGQTSAGWGPRACVPAESSTTTARFLALVCNAVSVSRRRRHLRVLGPTAPCHSGAAPAAVGAKKHGCGAGASPADPPPRRPRSPPVPGTPEPRLISTPLNQPSEQSHCEHFRRAPAQFYPDLAAE